jgi:Tn3 transposase DDE domain
VGFGHNQDFLYGDKIEQEIAEGCRRLIKNAIVCWNYLYLSHKISAEPDEARRQAMLRAVKNGSVASWGHLNLHGEYDFSDERLQDSLGLQWPLPSLFHHTKPTAENSLTPPSPNRSRLCTFVYLCVPLYGYPQDCPDGEESDRATRVRAGPRGQEAAMGWGVLTVGQHGNEKVITTYIRRPGHENVYKQLHKQLLQLELF